MKLTDFESDLGFGKVKLTINYLADHKNSPER
jgi:hypothetical protein